VVLERLDNPASSSPLREPVEAALALARRSRLLRRRPWPGFGEPFNGQAVRRRTIDLLVREFSPDAMIETGTFLGFTTRHIAAYGLPTYTVEVSPRFRYAARYALRDLDNVTLIWGDSAVALRRLAEQRKLERPFAYLDAHWEEDVPLQAELDCLLANWEDVVVAVDDFRVPADPGYAYDIYGGVPLSLEELALPPTTTVAYPAVAAIDESGSRRGTLYLGKGAGRSAIEAGHQAGLLTIQG
jgi:predicted O-methyltransferase YrrM